jgi:hypothetical protein
MGQFNSEADNKVRNTIIPDKEFQFCLSKYIENFEKQIDDLKSIFVDGATNRSTTYLSIIIWAMLNRSIANVQGFIDAIKQRNFLLIPSILRLQLDSLIRLFAFNLVSNPYDLAEKVWIKKKEFSEIKDRVKNL